MKLQVAADSGTEDGDDEVMFNVLRCQLTY